MYIIIIKRENIQGETVFIPIMKADENGDPGDSMATWETRRKAEEFCRGHILARSSVSVIINAVDYYMEEFIP